MSWQPSNTAQRLTPCREAAACLIERPLLSGDIDLARIGNEQCPALPARGRHCG